MTLFKSSVKLKLLPKAEDASFEHSKKELIGHIKRYFCCFGKSIEKSTPKARGDIEEYQNRDPESVMIMDANY